MHRNPHAPKLPRRGARRDRESPQPPVAARRAPPRTLARGRPGPQAHPGQPLRLAPGKVALLRRLLADEALVAAGEAFAVERSLPHGHVELVLEAMRRLGLPALLDRRRNLVLALVAAPLAPVLVLVIYNGASRWTAARRVIDLVTPAASDDPEPDLSRTSPLFAGDGYVTVDSGRLGADDLLPDNAAALLAGIEHPTTDTVLGLTRRLLARLRDPDLRGLRESVLAWAQRVVERRLHFDLGVDDMAEADRLQDPEEEEAYWEARRKAMFEPYIAEGRRRRQGRSEGREQGRSEGREQGRSEARAEERALLRRQAARRFGAAAGARLSAYLEDVDDAGQLAEVGDWIVDCASGAELAERLGAARRG